jgi:hypothetical protein
MLTRGLISAYSSGLKAWLQNTEKIGSNGQILAPETPVHGKTSVPWDRALAPDC